MSRLVKAVKKDDLGGVAAALDAGDDVNALSFFFRESPLRLAAERGNVEVTRLLLERGASVNAMANGRTPLFSAVCAGRAEVVELLLQRGADLAVRCMGKPPLQAALERYSADPEMRLIRSLISALPEHGPIPAGGGYLRLAQLAKEFRISKIQHVCRVCKSRAPGVFKDFMVFGDNGPLAERGFFFCLKCLDVKELSDSELCRILEEAEMPFRTRRIENQEIGAIVHAAMVGRRQQASTSVGTTVRFLDDADIWLHRWLEISSGYPVHENAHQHWLRQAIGLEEYSDPRHRSFARFVKRMEELAEKPAVPAADSVPEGEEHPDVAPDPARNPFDKEVALCRCVCGALLKVLGLPAGAVLACPSCGERFPKPEDGEHTESVAGVMIRVMLVAKLLAWEAELPSAPVCDHCLRPTSADKAYVASRDLIVRANMTALFARLGNVDQLKASFPERSESELIEVMRAAIRGLHAPALLCRDCAQIVFPSAVRDFLVVQGAPEFWSWDAIPDQVKTFFRDYQEKLPSEGEEEE
jgi:hypothetical protein